MLGILKAFGALVLDSHSRVELEDEPRPAGDAGQRANCTVLAIDDDPIILQTLRPALRDQGFNVLTSTSGPKGLDMLRYAGYDIRVVLLDYNMPQLNGAETLLHVRRLNPEAKVIALTGVNINLLPETFCEGVDKLVQKPFRTGDLVAAIRELLGEAPPAPPASQA
ncbi:MAG TPA: response regulator [Verrucomicrobiae bacterium]|nr:response regulator [Verrucomicrobiae bacterium]